MCARRTFWFIFNITGVILQTLITLGLVFKGLFRDLCLFIWVDIFILC